MGGGDTTSIADNKDSNDKYNPNSYIEFPLRHFGYSETDQSKYKLHTNPRENITAE